MGESARSGRRKGVATILAALAALATRANASYISNDERIEAQAEISAQNTFFHNDADNIEWVQERNEVKLGFRYYLVPVTQDLLGFLHRPRLSIQYRGRYDSVFDVRGKYKDLGLNRDDFRFPEGEYPREMYFDGELVHPLDWLSFRIGRQQIVWGEADLFRSLDVINPLRLDQNGLIGERFDDYREPLLIAKFLAHIGELPGLSNATLEFFYSPNSQPLTNHAVVGEGFRLPVTDSICPTISSFTLNPLVAPAGTDVAPPAGLKCLRRIARPFGQVRHPWEISRVGPYTTEAPNFANTGLSNQDCHSGVPGNNLRNGCGDFVYLITDEAARDWVSLDSSMAGVRLFGQTFKGIDISLDYIFKRSEVPGTRLQIDDLFAPAGSTQPGTGLPEPLGAGDGSPNPRSLLLAEAATAALDPNIDPNGLPRGINDQIRKCVVQRQPQIIFASVHGKTPFSGNGTTGLAGANTNVFTGCELVNFWYPWTHILGVTATWNDNEYTGFIWRLEQSYSTKEPRTNHPPLAADRAGNYPTTNDFDTHLKRTTGVWRSMIGFDYLRTIWGTAPLWVRRQPWGTLLTDQWFFTFQFFDEYYTNVRRTVGLLDSVTDRQQQFNPILTYVMTGFFAHDTLRPFIAAGYDVNAQFPVTWVQAEYFLTPKLSIKIADIEYLGSRHNESFLFLHRYADRDTFFVKATYFLL